METPPSASPYALPSSPNKDRNPILGRGGFLGPSLHITGLQLHRYIEVLRVYIITSLWLLTVVEFFFGLLLLTPLNLFGPWGRRVYIYASSGWDAFSQGAILCVPFSWCGTTVWTSSWDELKKAKTKGSSLYMSNHSSRVDWLMGLFLGYIDCGPRVHVRFIAEFTMCLMPIAGWSRYLLGDILLRRTFHRDAANVKRRLAEWVSAPLSRMIFFAPEGAIADVGNTKDTSYIDACEAFMAELGRPKLKFLLTPRYKGLSIFREHAEDNIHSVTMVFITSEAPFGSDVAFGADGAVSGGSLCVLPLRDPQRVVPDLHTVFGGGLHVYLRTDHVYLPEEDLSAASAQPGARPNYKLRDMLLDDYSRKDDELLHFQRNRKFSNVKRQEDWRQFPCPHLLMNANILAYAVIGLYGVSFLHGITLHGAFVHCATVWACFVVMHAISHVVGVAVSGHSRESLVGESAFKAILELTKGGLDHGKANGLSKKGTKSS